jgi:hypothetical protein
VAVHDEFAADFLGFVADADVTSLTAGFRSSFSLAYAFSYSGFSSGLQLVKFDFAVDNLCGECHAVVLAAFFAVSFWQGLCKCLLG